jgi:opacity protein-like surface antigen
MFGRLSAFSVELLVLCVVVVASSMMPAVAFAGDPSMPAVSGPNGKFSVEGGQYDDDSSFLALGSYSLPLGHEFGLQADGAIGNIDGEVMRGGGVHLFTRDPSKYLLGVYGSFHTWDSIDIWRTAAELELYLNRFSVTGLTGYENVDLPSTQNGLLVLDSDDAHFFGQIDLAYYPTDNLMLSGGYRYVNEVSLGSVGAEYLIQGAGVPISLFAKGDFGDSDYNRITGGMKLYFGADDAKPLITRHRTEDPQNYTPVFPQVSTAANKTLPPNCECTPELIPPQ